MKELIRKLCLDLEKEKDIKVLFAVENGSRAWGMESKDSDYDVRFVFVRNIRDYLGIIQKDDVINVGYDENGHEVKKDAMIDMSGFDIKKFAELLSKSNPTLIEWLMTDILYYGKRDRRLIEHVMNNYNPKALYHHYKNMCQNNYVKYIKSGNLITYKKYLYSYRGLVNAKWVEHKKCLAPINFGEAVVNIKDVLPEHISKKILDIIKLKSNGQEKDAIKNIKRMDQYIENFLKDKGKIESTRKIDKNKLSDLVASKILKAKTE